ncbi:polysaccharide biosynthesis C-terminal domain-containing protein [Cellulophaga baltica]|uniref:polysaccharide biosynthesis C-terminal domain-containing protein n=1 Tax=Cellulophaga baltica TaxID=76594 RepID=UPI002494CA7F|nr:polysaccharide biosynthesis C-terminal domain-containing protein [Cellulophaga baltica]
MYKSFESIITRGISILAKFLLITFLAKNLVLAEYGMYQLIAYFSFIAISIYGLEYYMHGNREIAKGLDNKQNINNHISFLITLLPLTFIIHIIAIKFLLPNELLTIKIVLIIIFINLSDYFNQEVYRYLIMIKKITKANLLLVAKSTLFLILVVSYYYFFKEINLDKVLMLMFLAYSILFTLTLSSLFKYIIKWSDIKLKILSLLELKKIFKILIPFLFLMVFTKGLEFFDKFAIEHLYGSEAVGVYSFLFAISTLVYVFVVSGFYLVYLPEFIKLNEEKSSQIKSKLIRFGVLVIISSAVLSSCMVFFIDILLNLIGKSALVDHLNILYILLIAFCILNFSLIPGILLYIRGREKIIMKITGVIFIFNLILNLIFLKLYNIKGAAIALLLTYILHFIITSYKAISEWTLMKKEFL